MVRRRLGEHLARQHRRCRRARARDRSGCAAGARDTCARAPRARQPRQHRDDARAPEVEVARDDRVPIARRAAAAAARGGAAPARASTASTTRARPRRRPRRRRTSTVHSSADARAGGIARESLPDRELAARDDREAASRPRAPTCPSPGIRVRAFAAPLIVSVANVDGLDAVAVVGELVEHPAAVVLAPRLGHDDDVGVEAAHDLARRRSARRGCAPKRPTPQWALNAATVKSVRRQRVR